MKREKIDALAIAKKEIKKERQEKIRHYCLIFIFLISLFLFLGLLSLNILDKTGHAVAISSQAGYITELTVHATKDTYMWGGIYGLVLRVPDFTQQLWVEFDSGEITRSDVFFDCIQYDATGGPEIYASNSSSLIISAATTTPATVEMVDNFLGCSGLEYCANNTFTKNMSIFIGETEIFGIPSTHTYKHTGENAIFDIGILNVSGKLVFVSHINESIQKGYNPEIIVNYQMLLPTPLNSTQTYYFYADPNDVCPAGGIGNSINATVYGYALDESGSGVGNVTVSVAGYSTMSNASGFYNLSTLVLEGNYHFVAQKQAYKDYIGNVSLNFTTYVVYKNFTLETESSEITTIITPTVSGYVKDIAGTIISGVAIYLGDSNTTSNDSGFYSFSPSVLIGDQPIIAIKTNYDNYYSILTLNSNTTSLNHNITMDLANLYNYPTGPYAESKQYDTKPKKAAQQKIENTGEDYWVSTKEINKQVRENTFIEEKISLYNFKNTEMQILISISSEIEDIVKIDKTALSISSDTFESIILTISGTKPIGIYKGTITISGDLEQDIPVKIEIVPRKIPIETLIMEVDLFKEVLSIKDSLKYRLNLQNLLTEQDYKINLKHKILDANISEIYAQEDEEVEIENSLTLLNTLDFPKNISEGEYLLKIEADYLGFFSSIVSPFRISRPLYLYSFFGIPLWIIFLAMSIISFGLFNFYLYERHLEKKKRFHTKLRLDTLPKDGERSIKIGKVAETKIPAYYNIDDFTTHGIVAGATGGGKSIAAQVFVEEILKKDIAVIVFDPTAQWSGMLRKCDDKKMMSFYPKFGLKPSDARAFPGNVRQITNSKESIHVEKYINPGQIQIFTMNKLTPTQIDLFVAGVISNIFKSDPKEFPNLRVLLVFDEVHRLLPKFGGSGKGFLQIERACREFRKWGFGVMLVSQVLSDFVGEIKANINTEIQMRVAEENDLKRIQERYGEDSLKSLVRAGVGTGMIQNAEYNKGMPYFVNLRPILHNTRRLTDEVLEKYNSYGETIDDLEYQIEQLEKEKVDTFDLRMELKLVKDKLMTGNFTVVDIYLEGLKPRMEKQWESLGKKPKKKEIELIDEKELETALDKAQKERDKIEKENKTEDKQSEEKNTKRDDSKEEKSGEENKKLSANEDEGDAPASVPLSENEGKKKIRGKRIK